MSRRSLAVLAAALLAGACTGTTQTDTLSTPTRGGSGACDLGSGCTIEAISGDVTYRLECLPVPEALVDIELPRGTGRQIRAITGVAAVQGVAVMWRDPGGCGLWVLALADGLSTGSADAIREEMARGVERFGVTASPVPQEPEAE